MKKFVKKTIALILAIPSLAMADCGATAAVVLIIFGCMGVFAVYKVMHVTIPSATAQYDGTVGVQVEAQEIDPQTLEMIGIETAMGLSAYDFAPLTSEPVPAAPADEASPACFAVLYGISGTGKPWVAGGQLNPVLDDSTAGFALNILSNNGTQCVFTVSLDGQLMTCTYTNMGSTNDNGSYTFSPVYSVVIERNTNNFVDWQDFQPVWTNQIAVGTINQFTDFDGPFDRAFYRARLAR